MGFEFDEATLQAKAVELRRAYHREANRRYREQHKDKLREYEQRRWLKKAAEALAAENEQNEK